MKRFLLSLAGGLLMTAGMANAATVYFEKPASWGTNITTWNWNTGGEGTAGTTEAVTIDGHDLYMAETDKTNIIFRNGDGWDDGKTSDLEVEDNAVYNIDSYLPVAHIIDGAYVAGTPIEPSEYPDMYLVSEMTGWGPSSKYKFQTTDGVTYTLNVPEAEPNMAFKVNGGNWQTRCFSNGEQNMADGTYTIRSNEQANMTLATGGNVTLSIVQHNNFEYIELTISGQGDTPVDEFPAMYVVAQSTGWNATADYKFQTTDGVTYTLHVPDAHANMPFKVFGGNWNTRCFSNGQQNMANGTYTIRENNTNNMTLATGGDVTLTLVQHNNFEYIDLTIAGQEEDPSGFTPIFLVGDMTDWHANSAYKFQTEDGKNYTLSVTGMSGDTNFKILGDDEHENLFSNGRQNLADGTYTLTPDVVANMSLDEGGDVTFTVVLADDHSSVEMTIAGQQGGEDEYPEMYLVGAMTGWGAKDAYKMTTTDGETYTLNVPSMTTEEFKFFGGDWGIRELTGAGGGLANGTYELTGGRDNMTLAIGGNVTFTLVAGDAEFTTATLTIAGQQGEVVETITYALHGNFMSAEWASIALTQDEGAETWSATFTPVNTDGINFGVRKNRNGIQVPGAAGWFSDEVTFDADNTTFTLGNGNGDCNFGFTVDGEAAYTATYNPETCVLTIVAEGGDVPPVPQYPAMYLVGQITNGAAVEDFRMETLDGKTYTLSVTDMDNGWFKFFGGEWGVRELTGAGTLLENGTYDLRPGSDDMSLAIGGDVQFTLVAADDTFESATLTIAGQQGEVVIVTTYALHGNFSGEWGSIQLDQDADDENLWHGGVTATNLNAEFGVQRLLNGTQAAEEGWWAADFTFDDEHLESTLSSSAPANCVFGFPTDIAYTVTYNAETHELSFVQGEYSAVETIEAVDGEAVYFNLQGVRIDRPEKGLYIEVRNGQTRKVIL